MSFRAETRGELLKEVVPLQGDEDIEHSRFFQYVPDDGSYDGFGISHAVLDFRAFIPASVDDFGSRVVAGAHLVEEVPPILIIIGKEI